MNRSGRAMLFDEPFETDNRHPNHDVFPDGSGFVMVRTNEESRRLVVVLHWVAELRQRLGRVKRRRCDLLPALAR